jgi:hypothetical protein
VPPTARGNTQHKCQDHDSGAHPGSKGSRSPLLKGDPHLSRGPIFSVFYIRTQKSFPRMINVTQTEGIFLKFFLLWYSHYIEGDA